MRAILLKKLEIAAKIGSQKTRRCQNLAKFAFFLCPYILAKVLNTIPGFVYERVRSGLLVPGVIEVKRTTPIGQAIDELEIMIDASTPDEYENQVRYIPIR